MSDMDKMQADAIGRAKEMYSRRTPIYSVNSFPNSYNGNMKSSPPNSSGSKQKSESKPPPIPKSDRHDKNENIEESLDCNDEPTDNQPQTSSDTFDSIFADKEKALIILLIALLNEEKASSSLLLALMYLII